jgi:phosphoribosylformylglycinamidine synthase
LDFKIPGDLIYLIGQTKDELGGSQYLNMLGQIGTNVPMVNLELAKKTYKQFSDANHESLIVSAISLNLGGLAVAVAKSSIANNLGAEIDLTAIETADTTLNLTQKLFSESQSRILVSVNPKDQKAFEEKFQGLPLSLIGKVSENPQITIKNKEENLTLPLDEIKKAYFSSHKYYA